jgi:phosphotransferase system  glucose/maltose/N-acetylglucosamine-specific IIC component
MDEGAPNAITAPSTWFFTALVGAGVAIYLALRQPPEYAVAGICGAASLAMLLGGFWQLSRRHTND